MASNKHPKRSAARATEHEQHYSARDALAGRANQGSTTPARGLGQTRYDESLNDRIKQRLQKNQVLAQMTMELLRDG